MTQVVFSRSLVGDGSLGSLTIGTDPAQPYWLDEGGLSLPGVSQRVTFADGSAHVAGALPTQAVDEVGTLSLTVYTRAADGATLNTQMKALGAVLRQFTYTAAVTLFGTDTYTCLPGQLAWGGIDSGNEEGLIVTAALTIPTQPLDA